MAIQWLDDDTVTAVRITDQPRYGQTVTGYGRKIPTRYQLKIGPRWHRVYMMQYSNSGTAYVLKGGKTLVLENNTEHRIESHRPGAGPSTTIHSLKVGERFRFHHDGVVCTYVGTTGSRYAWTDYQGNHDLYAGTYAGTGKTAWPYVYPTTEPETEVKP